MEMSHVENTRTPGVVAERAEKAGLGVVQVRMLNRPVWLHNKGSGTQGTEETETSRVDAFDRLSFH